MELYILRHGDAVDLIAGGYTSDGQRPLSAQGQEEVAGVAAGLANLGLCLDRLLTSPLVRARQTADLLAASLTVAEPPTICPDLGPGGQLTAILNAARRGQGTGASRRGQRVMVVGHLPSLGQLAAWLVWGDPDLAIPLRTAGLCRVDLADGAGPGQGDLRWLLPPRLTRRLSQAPTATDDL